MGYTHLTKEERDRLAVLHSKGWTLRAISTKMGRDKGTLSRELKRNKSGSMYLPHKAQEKAELRENAEHKSKRLKTYALAHDIERMVMDGLSPELIAGRLALQNGGRRVISHESIYQWIYSSAPHLKEYLVRAHQVRYFRRGLQGSKLKIPERVPITERPAHISLRQEPGHWETDLMVSAASKAALQVSTERTTRLTRIKKLAGKTARESRTTLAATLREYPAHFRRSLTYDNGSENYEHNELNRELGMRSYFCEAYHSWEKGTVENTNGLIRRFLPKKTDFAKIPEAEIERIEQWLNNRPRKCLGFYTPTEVFNGFVALAP